MLLPEVEMEGSLALLRERAEQVPILRVATPLLNQKPGAYIPQFLSLGPYHHWILKKKVIDTSFAGGRSRYHRGNLKMSIAEGYKEKIAHSLSLKLPSNDKTLDDIVEMIQGMRVEIERFYDWRMREDEYSIRNFALMMAVDSLFLLRFLISLLSHENDDPCADIDLSTLRVCIKWDILKLENQIPLFVLKQVFDNVKGALLNQLFYPFHQHSFTRLLGESYMQELCPFVFSDMRYLPRHHNMSKLIEDAAKNEPHLLGCMHTLVSPFLNIERYSTEPRLLQRICNFLCKQRLFKPASIPSKRPIHAYSAGQLARAGIKFKSFSTLSKCIRFDPLSHTLYLPRMTLISSMQTEVFFRNLVALEFNDTARSNIVTRYVVLMDCLIDTPDDVRLLRDSHVILCSSLTLTDEYIAKMWHGISQPFFDGHLQPPQDLKTEIDEVLKNKYYWIKFKIMLFESWKYYYERYLSRPWKFVALLFGVLLLAMNFIQAFCNFYKCKSDHSK